MLGQEGNMWLYKLLFLVLRCNWCLAHCLAAQDIP